MEFSFAFKIVVAFMVGIILALSLMVGMRWWLSQIKKKRRKDGDSD